MTVTAADAYATQSAYVNNMAHIHRDETFIAEFLSDHRTLQSQVASLWLKTLYAWVEADPDGTFTDERNLPAWRKAKAVTVALGPDGWAVPFV